MSAFDDLAAQLVDEQIATFRQELAFPAFVSTAQSECLSNGDAIAFDLRCERCDTIAREKSGSSIEDFIFDHVACPPPPESLAQILREFDAALHERRWIPPSRLSMWATRIRAARDDRDEAA